MIAEVEQFFLSVTRGTSDRHWLLIDKNGCPMAFRGSLDGLVAMVRQFHSSARIVRLLN